MGGGVVNERIVLETLGFSYEVLKAENYGVYGIYEGDDNKAQYSGNLRSQFREEINKIGIPTDLSSAQHNYLLLTLKGCTAKDFDEIRRDNDSLRTMLTAAGDGYKRQVLSHGRYRLECRVFQNIHPARSAPLLSIFPRRHSGRFRGDTAP
jgi:hypothetical protein